MPRKRANARPKVLCRASAERLGYLTVLHGCVLALAFCCVLATATSASAKSRRINWSGYTWTVRDTGHQHANPGNNVWSDSKRNVRKLANGSLRMNIARGRTTELVGPRLGYGRYRWVVNSNLANKLNDHRVIAFFTHHIRRQNSAGEQDLEFAHWGDMQRPAGWYVSWLSSGKNAYGNFSVSPSPPYTLDLTWKPGRVEFHIKDGFGQPLLDQSLPTHFSAKYVAPSMSYWLWGGNRWDPRTKKVLRGPHPPVIVRSFHHTKLANLAKDAHVSSNLTTNPGLYGSRYWRDDFARLVQYTRPGRPRYRVGWPRFFFTN